MKINKKREREFYNETLEDIAPKSTGIYIIIFIIYIISI